MEEAEAETQESEDARLGEEPGRHVPRPVESLAEARNQEPLVEALRWAESRQEEEEARELRPRVERAPDQGEEGEATSEEPAEGQASPAR